MSNRTHQANSHTGFDRCQMLAAETNNLIQDSDNAAVLAHIENRKRTTENMALHPRNEHMDKLPRHKVGAKSVDLNVDNPKPIRHLPIGYHYPSLV